MEETDSFCSKEFIVQEEVCNAYHIKRCKHIDEAIHTSYDVIIDAVFGIGLSRNLNPFYCQLFDKINQMQGLRVAVDMPSGIDADSGQIMGAAIKCDYTITFSFEKLGQMLWPGNEYSGKVICAPMGITKESWLDKKPQTAYLEEADLSMLPKRPAHSNKGTFGKLLIIAGSVNMAGAAILCGKASYRVGVGLVKVITPEENRAIFQSALPEAVLCTYGKTIQQDAILKELQWADAVVIGPGIGTDVNARKLVDIVLKNINVPLVMDADALNIIAEDSNRLLLPHTDMIVTPHLGEMSRLTGNTISWIQNHILESAKDFASQYNVTCVLKDFHTIIANAYGLCYVNLTGNSGMATAGSGDVLSGIIGGLLALGMESEKASSCGVMIHGMAGDKASLHKGEAAVMASDIIEGLCYIMK
jgi:NAD(P)H-hydrate epimerase